MTAFVVVNPASGGGRTRRDWPLIERGLNEVYRTPVITFTRRRGEAAQLVRQALMEGHLQIVAVGGDGTINEAINGFFDVNGSISPDAVFSFITSGTGGDFRKTFGVEAGAEPALARLRHASVRRVDVGRISCLSLTGEPVVRHFVNIASFGLSGLIVDSVNRAQFSKLFGGKFAFAFHSALAMLRHKDRTVRLRLHNDMDEISRISTVAIANGQYFGGGMRVAPGASPDDGTFDVVVLGGAAKGQSLKAMNLIYTGEHVGQPNVRVLRGPQVVAAPVAETGHHPVLIEADGESAGQLPATFDILPRALNLRV